MHRVTNVSDALDRSILDLLQEDGRLPSLEVARRLGVSEKTIRTRIGRLVRDHGMRVVATLDGAQRQTRMLFLVHTAPGCRFEVADRLARLDDVQRVFATTGAFDLVVEGAFSTDADALDFLVHDVEGIQGVESCESVHLIKDVLPGRTPIENGKAGDAAGKLDFPRFVALAARTTTPDELLTLAAEAALSMCGADRSLISMLEIQDLAEASRRVGSNGPHRVLMSTSRASGLSEGYVEEVIRRVNSGQNRGVSYRVVESGLHVFVEDALVDPLLSGLHDLVRAEGYRSLVAVPMLWGREVIGTVNLYYDQVRQLNDDAIAIAQAFADQVAVGLSRLHPSGASRQSASPPRTQE